jgi:hypothetical protein
VHVEEGGLGIFFSISSSGGRSGMDVQATVAERRREETSVTRDENPFDEGGPEVGFKPWALRG